MMLRTIQKRLAKPDRAVSSSAKAGLMLAALCFGLGAGAQAQGAPPAASVSVKLSVPSALRSSPLDVDRYLNLPPNFSISVLARVPGARFMAVAPNNDVLVSVPGAGKVVLVRPQASGVPLVSDFASGLRNPHDIVFHSIGSATYLYISESNQIDRFVYNAGDTGAHDRQIVVAGLPDSSSAELHGAYGHQLKNIALDPDHKLYVAIASATNASPSDAMSNPVRCAVYQYNADGSGGRLFARGLRNAEGLALVPGTNELWVTVNNRDNTPYPFHNDFDGDGSDDYGKVLPAYVDNHPPDEFTRVSDGANYGWPFANPDPDTASGVDNMPFDFDVENNAGGSFFPIESFTRISKGLPAHSAALGLSFLQSSSFAPAYRNGAVIALHGSWNRTRKSGYKVIYFPWNGGPGPQMDLVNGWLDPASQAVWGRPVDAVPDNDGGLLISDDYAGAIYRLKYLQASNSASTWAGLDLAAGTDNKMRALWAAPDGRAALWTHAADGALESAVNYGPYEGWAARQVAVGSDGKMRALWTNADGRAGLWRVLPDGSLDSNLEFGPYPNWSATYLAVGGDGKARLMWSNPDGRIALWRVGLDGSQEVNDTYGPFPGWTARSLAVGSDNKFRVMWSHSDGRAAFWTLRPDRSLEVNATYGPYPGWTPLGIAAGGDGKTRVLWANADGRAVLWTMSTDGSRLESNLTYGPYPNWTPRSIAVGGDAKTRVLWSNSDGRSALWSVAADGSLEVNSTHGPLPG